jgi:hypothetical protein
MDYETLGFQISPNKEPIVGMFRRQFYPAATGPKAVGRRNIPRMHILRRSTPSPSRIVHRACRTGSLFLVGFSVTATIASCGRSPGELKAQASKAADHCIKIGTKFTQSLQDCLRREAPFGPLVSNETGKSTHVCYPAKRDHWADVWLP